MQIFRPGSTVSSLRAATLDGNVMRISGASSRLMPAGEMACAQTVPAVAERSLVNWSVVIATAVNESVARLAYEVQAQSLAVRLLASGRTLGRTAMPPTRDLSPIRRPVGLQLTRRLARAP